MTEPFKIDTLDVSLYKSYMCGEITLYEAAVEFSRHGWDNYIDENKTQSRFARLSERVAV